MNQQLNSKTATIASPSQINPHKLDNLNNIYELLTVLEDYLCFNENDDEEKNRVARNGAVIIVQQLMETTEQLIRNENIE